MKYFPKPDPMFIRANNDLIRNKESNILAEIRKVRVLKKLQKKHDQQR
jgi:hypothetical protein